MTWNGLNKVSKKQQSEIRLRREIKHLLVQQQLDITGYTFCQTCQRSLSFVDLSHVIALSRGGLTSLDNCILECRDCHNKYEKRPETRPEKSIGLLKYLAQK